TGAAVRLLPQRLDHDRGRVPRADQKTERRADQGDAVRPQVPLRHAYGHLARGQARRRRDGLREAAVTKMHKHVCRVSPRSLRKAGGALVVSIGMPIAFDTVLRIGEAFAQGVRPPLTPEQLSSYIAVNADGTISAFFGKTDMGQGVFVAIGQMVAEELD